MLIVNENFGINAKINCHLPYGVSFNLPSYILSTPKFIFVSSPRIFFFLFWWFYKKRKPFKVLYRNYKSVSLCFAIVAYWTHKLR